MDKTEDTQDTAANDADGAVRGESATGSVSSSPPNIGDVLQPLVTQMATLNVNLDVRRQNQAAMLKAVVKPGPNSATPNHQASNTTSHHDVHVAVSADISVHGFATLDTGNRIQLALGGSITEKTQKSAFTGEFVNIAEFMPCIANPDPYDMETVMSQSGSMYMRPCKPRKSIDSFTSWLSAWSNYESLIIAHKPELYNNMTQKPDTNLRPEVSLACGICIRLSL